MFWRHSGQLFFQNTWFREVWVYRAGRPISGLHHHAEINLGRPETVCGRGRLLWKNGGDKSHIRRPAIMREHSIRYPFYVILDGEHDGNSLLVVSWSRTSKKWHNTDSELKTRCKPCGHRIDYQCAIWSTGASLCEAEKTMASPIMWNFIGKTMIQLHEF